MKTIELKMCPNFGPHKDKICPYCVGVNCAKFVSCMTDEIYALVDIGLMEESSALEDLVKEKIKKAGLFTNEKTNN